MMKSSFQLQTKNGIIVGKSYRMNDTAVYPAVILCHELGLSMISTARYAEKLVDLGYAVFVFDFCGSGWLFGKSKGIKSAQMSVLTQVDDLQSVIGYVKTLPFVNQNRIILGGCSQGGFVAALTAAKTENQIEKLILYYPALCIPDDTRKGVIIGKHIDLANIPSHFTVMGYLRLGRRYIEDARELEPWKEICGYANPVLICHGTKDGIVDIAYAQKAAQCYPNAKLVAIEGAHHVLVNAGFRKAIKATRQFLNDTQ